MKTKIKSGQTVLFIGDSINDCDRRGNNFPLGFGYVKLFSNLLLIREPEKEVTIINKGIGGHRIDHLKDRWTDDVIRNKPDWLSIKVGINDLHSVLRNAPDAVSPKKFEELYDQVLTRTKKELPKCELLLIQPFYLSIENDKDAWRKKVLDLLPKYLSVVEKMSKKYRARLIKTHQMFQRILKYHDTDTLAPEPVHPNPVGHLAIAEAVYEALSK